jgi:hypothetical protein
MPSVLVAKVRSQLHMMLHHSDGSLITSLGFPRHNWFLPPNEDLSRAIILTALSPTCEIDAQGELYFWKSSFDKASKTVTLYDTPVLPFGLANLRLDLQKVCVFLLCKSPRCAAGFHLARIGDLSPAISLRRIHLFLRRDRFHFVLLESVNSLLQIENVIFLFSSILKEAINAFSPSQVSVSLRCWKAIKLFILQ